MECGIIEVDDFRKGEESGACVGNLVCARIYLKFIYFRILITSTVRY